MHRQHSLVLTVLIIAVTLLAGVTEGIAQTSKSSPSAPARSDYARIMLVPRLAVGMVTGDAADLAGDRAQDKLVFGVALSAEYYFRPVIAAGVCASLDFKGSSEYYSESIRALSIGVSGLYLLSNQAKGGLYLRSELGSISGTLPDGSGDDGGGSSSIDLGSFTFFRMGIGLLHHGRSKSDGRIELFYRHLFTDDHKLGELNYVLPFNISEIGIEFAFGISII